MIDHVLCGTGKLCPHGWSYPSMHFGAVSMDIAQSVVIKNKNIKVAIPMPEDYTFGYILDQLKRPLVFYSYPHTSSTIIHSITNMSMIPLLQRNGIFHDYASSYIGCFVDWPTRELPHEYMANEQMQPQKCISHCRYHNYPFAALQYAQQCYCGIQPGAIQVHNSECNMACSGSASQWCGGSWRNSVYSTVSVHLAV